MSNLTFVPRSEFERARTLNADAYERTALFATLARLNALSMIAFAGSGHIGSSFSSLDIVSWLYLNEMRLPTRPDREEARDIFFSSKGHDIPGLYAVMIALGQLPEASLQTLRRLGGLPGHPDVLLTPYIEANTGSLGMGISKAKGMAIAQRLKGETRQIYVLTGDGELQEGQIWESLASAAARGLGEITVIVDHNKVQSDTYVAKTSDLGDLPAKFTAFGWHVQRVDGHDLPALAAAVKVARERPNQPSVIVADTIKGRGVSFMEHTAMTEHWYRYHSGAPSVADYDRAIAELVSDANARLARLGASALAVDTVARPAAASPQSEPQRLVKAYGEAILAEAARIPELVALDADLVLDTGLIPFSQTYPDRFIECGIAEMDMVSQASGLALAGMLPVCHSFACFLTPRANEQIYNTATEARRVVLVGSLAGVVPGTPGHSHQSVRDIAIVGCMPHMDLLEPSCEAEVPMVLDFALRRAKANTYIRLVSIPCQIPFTLPDGYQLTRGRGVALTEGSDAVLISYGPVMLAEAWHAAQSLKSAGIGLKVVNLPWLAQVDADWLLREVQGSRHVITLDNHYIAGGQGERVAAVLARYAEAPPVTCLGLTELPACGQYAEVLRNHQLDAEAIAHKVRQVLGVV